MLKKTRYIRKFLQKEADDISVGNPLTPQSCHFGSMGWWHALGITARYMNLFRAEYEGNPGKQCDLMSGGRGGELGLERRECQKAEFLHTQEKLWLKAASGD